MYHKGVAMSSFCERDKHFPPGYSLVPLLKKATSFVKLSPEELLTGNQRVRVKRTQKRKEDDSCVRSDDITMKEHCNKSGYELEITSSLVASENGSLSTSNRVIEICEGDGDQLDDQLAMYLKNGSVLSPDLFQPCADTVDNSGKGTDDISLPTSRSIKRRELRKIACQKKLESVKKLEQSDQRRIRFLKRQKRFDDDDGCPTVGGASDNDSPKKSKKRVMWPQQDSDLFEFHIYSPVTVEERELTPVISSS